MAKVTIKLDGTETTVDLDQNGDVILEAGLTAGLDVPFSCQGGICTTCMAKLDSGTVSMDSNFALSEKEIADGFILTCQSHPTSDEVIVNYDAV
ncbi:MAG: 2Fe-2S iron-sulfur cluster binding domain-containing protein [Flavobacteriales bacterium]|jgi:ring-1,2-phenylacetyl-CoA epoxidase subunit PaaE|nr:2Fe-2S iron-sulfur cluster binding domain-containing protein [Flavobacteriales bacterium]MBT6746804.1 2Fe-2S iron-sulfur cluster binding domain-containing protein [Flavobacteriales bacterium]|tara:strand:- start:427 stop:708 length:282 start_codon:yes stop_codon:yes gene_type:complete